MRIAARILTWLKHASVLRGHGDERAADLLERLAAELEADLHNGAAEIVDMSRAVEITG